MLKSGTVLKDRYEIKGLLGAGGVSQVYAAYDREGKRTQVIKEIRNYHKDQVRVMVQKEAELIQRLKYPYFPALEEVITGKDVCYLVMEYLEGETLEKILQRTGPQSQEDVVCWAKDMCLVLGYLHNCKPPVIYRDMKPGNIMLQPGGNLRLIDFGGVWEKRNGQKIPEVSLGTKGYAAPEQLAGEEVDARTDIYGLGVTMYHLLTGKDPRQFPCEQYGIRRWNRRLSRKLEKIIQTCTRKNPKERYDSCEELLSVLKTV
ncbi:MAG: serine/threonine protein kinase [Lachnospiraceae bacterium]|nr:serine/threonine protein kinase [Lachnospiraceae bacterium]